MPRKTLPQWTDAQIKRAEEDTLADTPAAWQRREKAIVQLCELLDANPDDPNDRHKVFGHLATWAFWALPGMTKRRGRRKGTFHIWPEDIKVLADAYRIAIERALASDSNLSISDVSVVAKIVTDTFSDALDAAIDSAIDSKPTWKKLERPIHKKRLKSRLKRIAEDTNRGPY
jgi:hypothetical protein